MGSWNKTHFNPLPVGDGKDKKYGVSLMIIMYTSKAVEEMNQHV